MFVYAGMGPPYPGKVLHPRVEVSHVRRCLVFMGARLILAVGEKERVLVFLGNHEMEGKSVCERGKDTLSLCVGRERKAFAPSSGLASVVSLWVCKIGRCEC